MALDFLLPASACSCYGTYFYAGEAAAAFDEEGSNKQASWKMRNWFLLVTLPCSHIRADA
jgi:hypothetical protein